MRVPESFNFCCNCCNAARLVDNERFMNGSKVAEWQQTGGRGERLLFLAVTQCFSSQNSMLFTPKPIAFHPRTQCFSPQPHSFPNCNPMSGDLRCSFGTEKQKNKNHDSFFFKHELPLIEHEFFMNYGNHIEFDLTM